MRIAGQVLLDGRLGRCALFHGRTPGVGHLQRLQIRGDMERLDIRELADAMLFEPGEERAYGPVIGHTRVVVLDRGGEEIEKAPRCPVAGVGDHHRHRERTLQRRRFDQYRCLDDGRNAKPIDAHGHTVSNSNPRIGPPPDRRLAD